MAKRSAFEKAIAFRAYSGGINGSTTYGSDKARERFISEQEKEEIETCLNCTKEKCTGDERCVKKQMRRKKG